MGKLDDMLEGPVPEAADVQMEEDDATKAKPERQGFCVECSDHPSEVYCENCCEDQCSVCFESLHKRGTRKQHKYRKLKEGHLHAEAAARPAAAEAAAPPRASPSPPAEGVAGDFAGETEVSTLQPVAGGEEGEVPFAEWIRERAKFIPVRLTLEERKMLRLVEAAMNVSEYTDRVDIISYLSRPKRIYGQIKEICSVLCGLVVASDYAAGQALIKDKDFAANASFFQNVFEAARRYKILNPDKMRSTYGKLIYMLMDSQIDEVKEMLGFSCVIPVRTVYSTLEEAEALALLGDPLLYAATKEVVAGGRSRREIEAESRAKERAQETLSRRYANGKITPDDIKTLIYSMNDNHAHLRTCRDPCDKALAFLRALFDPRSHADGFDLSIQSGRGGARLTHDHGRQYAYVEQSLTLWSAIQHDFFRLWLLAEADLLDDENPYRMRDTGQGLNRVQAAPRVSRAIHQILNSCQRKLGSWVGSSVIHLGDHNVPNALMFIDKYTQVPRILNPLVLALEGIDTLIAHPDLGPLIAGTFRGPEHLRREILCDFFRYAFDGSGADNFFDAGSCIDGRLTSAWNWCSKVEKKRFFPVFLLTGFMGFDGNFQA